MRNDKLLGLLAKCLEMVNSDQDGEALAAARKANALREKMGIGWEEVLRSPGDLRRPGPIRHDMPSPQLEAEVAYLRSRLNEVQNDLLQARKAAHAAEIESRALREALAEGTAAMERRERELRQRLIEVEGMLDIERERNQQATARLGVLQDIKGHADRRVAAAERQATEARDQARALEKSNDAFLKRELTLRATSERADREARAARDERDRLEQRVADLKRQLRDRPALPAASGRLEGGRLEGGRLEGGRLEGALTVVGATGGHDDAGTLAIPHPVRHVGRGLVLLSPNQVPAAVALGAAGLSDSRLPLHATACAPDRAVPATAIDDQRPLPAEAIRVGAGAAADPAEADITPINRTPDILDADRLAEDDLKPGPVAGTDRAMQCPAAARDRTAGLLHRTQPVVFVENRGIVVEIKPLSRMFLYSSLKRARAAMDYARETGADYVVVSASGVTLNTLFTMDVDPAAAAAVLAEVDRRGQLGWSDYQDLRERHDLKTIHTGAIVLQNDLFFSRLPWRLKRLPDGESYDALRRTAAAIGTA